MNYTVLWVEEEGWTLRFEQRLAEKRGWVITSVESAAFAKEFVAKHAFDAIIVDLNIPSDEFDRRSGKVHPDAGLDLIRVIRTLDSRSATSKDVPLLVVTAVVATGPKAKVCEYLASSRHYLQKPLVEEEYVARLVELETLIDQRRMKL